MVDRYKYFNRDISWLSFNHRVLEEAMDSDLPLYERLKFLAIYSSNLDEFYKVRVAEYRNSAETGASMPDTDNPAETLRQINNIVSGHLAEFSKVAEVDILNELRENGIILYQHSMPTHIDHLAFMKDYFYTEIIPYLQPVLLNRGTRSFLRDNRLYLAIKLLTRKKNHNGNKGNYKRRPIYALVKLPTNDLPRFIELPAIDVLHHIMYIDDIIRYNLQELFPGYEIEGAWAVKLARDADLGIVDEFSGNLIEKIRKNLVKRKTGLPASFHHDRDIDPDLLQFLMATFEFGSTELVEAGRYQNMQDFFQFPNPYSPRLEWHSPAPIRPYDMELAGSVFSAIRKRERIMHYPYQSFDYVIKFLNEAAIDPKVEEIKVTQYRVATNSAVVNSLIAAARNHKKVTVFVEVKARFDEENNLYFAEVMKNAGIKIIYSIPGLKVHSKMALVLRKANGIRKKSYAYLSTGNFNEKTARQYADHGYFTCKEEIIRDMEKLFIYLEDQSRKPRLEKLLVTQINLKGTIMSKIDREIRLAQEGREGYILLKMNGIQNADLINKLYEASEAGVKVDVIIRGICCLVPNQPFSKNIRLIRLVDSYLEHARIWVFGNDGNKEMFLTSADWLNRNINRRIETAFPVEDDGIKQEILSILDLQLRDNVKARRIDENLRNVIPNTDSEVKIRAQHDTYEMLLEKNNELKQQLISKP